MNTFTNHLLREHRSAQCHVGISGDGDVYFISYSTTVIKAIRQAYGTYEISCTGTYSRTTIRQISWFLKEYFPKLNYYDMKSIAGTGRTIIYKRGN